jgi:hypothetical protein
VTPRVVVLVERPLPWHERIVASLGDSAVLTTDVPGPEALVLDLRPEPVAGEEVWAFEVGLGGLEGLTEPGRRELAAGLTTCAVRLVRLRAEGVQVLREGLLPLRGDSPRDVAEGLLDRLVDWPRWALAASDLPAAPLEPLAIGTPTPDLPWWLTLRRRLERRARDILVRERWTLGLCRGVTLEDLLAGTPLPAPHWAAEHSDFYLADPFDLPGTGRLMAERCSLAGAGEPADLVEVTWPDGQGEPLIGGQGPRCTEHLSYPSAFAQDGNLWCVPESAAVGEVALWRCTDGGWVKVRTLLPVPAVDPDLVLHDGTWWLFYGLATDRKDEELHLAWADSLDDDFHLHPLNPVVRDISAARGGGRPFVAQGRLHRPVQDCSLAYGGALALAEVEVLSPKDYRQRVVRRFAPIPPYIEGLHTLNAVEGGLVIDGKRNEVSLGMLTRKIGRRVRRLTSG